MKGTFICSCKSIAFNIPNFQSLRQFAPRCQEAKMFCQGSSLTRSLLGACSVFVTKFGFNMVSFEPFVFGKVHHGIFKAEAGTYWRWRGELVSPKRLVLDCQEPTTFRRWHCRPKAWNNWLGLFWLPMTGSWQLFRIWRILVEAVYHLQHPCQSKEF